MNKRVISAVLAAALCAGAVASRAEEKWTLTDWLKRLEAKVRNTEQKRSNQLAAAVAIRGDKKTDEAKQLYWKGKKDQAPASPEELAAFKEALGLAGDGKAPEARRAFASFLEKYPDSPMAGDAKQTLALLPAEAAPAAESPK